MKYLSWHDREKFGDDLQQRVIPYGFLLFVASQFQTVINDNALFLIACAIPAFISAALFPYRLSNTLSSYRIFWVLIVLLIVSSIAHTPDVSIKPIIYIALLFVYANLLAQAEPHTLNRIYCGLALLSILFLALAGFLWGVIYFSNETAPRISVFGIHPLRTASLICSGIVWYWVFHLDPHLQRRGEFIRAIGFAGFIFVLLFCAVVFQARAVLLGMTLFIPVYIFINWRFKLAIASLLVVLTIAYLLGWHEILANRGFSYRIEIWHDMWNHLISNCGLSSGCGDDGYLFLNEFSHPHSAYFSVLYQHGLPIFLFSVLCLAMLAVNGIKRRSCWLQVALFGWGCVITNTGGVFRLPSEHWIFFWIPTFFAMFECLAKGRINELNSA